MARTVQDAINRVRELLQDEPPPNAPSNWAGERYMTPQLLSYMGDAIEQARSVRPDLFIGKYIEDPLNPPPPLQLTDPFPLPPQLFNGTCYFIAGNAELRDDEFAVDGRAITLRDSFTKKLVSGM